MTIICAAGQVLQTIKGYGTIGSVPTPSNLNSPMYMIANLALNSSTPSTYSGGDLQIAYIRAYTLANSPVSSQNLTYSVNGLNQLTTAGALSYDARGNLTFDGVTSYSYDLLNRLVGAGAGVTTLYDPEDRLLSLTQGATTTQFAYVGPNVATEFNASNQILRRYVPGPGEDEPVVWFEGSDGANPRWLLQDHQGSVVAVTDMTGGALAINTYSDYGSPGSGNLGRYQFTGQFYLPEVGLYDYKARLYSPILARFMQTDPVGYKDGLNWYDYVHDDPVNHADPSGNCPECEVAAEEIEEAGEAVAESPVGRAVEGFAERGLESLEEGLGMGGKPSAPSAPSEFDAPRPEVHAADNGVGPGAHAGESIPAGQDQDLVRRSRARLIKLAKILDATLAERRTQAHKRVISLGIISLQLRSTQRGIRNATTRIARRAVIFKAVKFVKCLQHRNLLRPCLVFQYHSLPGYFS